MSVGEFLSLVFILVFPWIVLFLYWKIQFKAVKKKYGKRKD
ncbi:hypothetical protein [Aquifex aeolicus]|nr:hypothetical protein [Aquifex aeolicus]